MYCIECGFALKVTVLIGNKLSVQFKHIFKTREQAGKPIYADLNGSYGVYEILSGK